MRILPHPLLVLSLIACSVAGGVDSGATIVDPCNPKALVVFDGNSIGVGAGASRFDRGYVDLTWTALGGPEAWDMASNAIGGLTTPYADLIAPMRTDRRFLDTRPVNVAMLLEGTNDLGSLPCATEAECYQHLADYAAHRQAAGFVVVLATILPRVSPCPTFAAARLAVNARLRTSGILLADLAADARIGADGAELTSYFAADHVHPSDTGHAIIASIVTSAVRKALP